MTEADLRARLEALQAENAELYTRISILKEDNKSSPLVGATEADLESVKVQLADEEEERTRRKSKLKELTEEQQKLQKNVDRKAFDLEHSVKEYLGQKRKELTSHFHTILEFFRNGPNFDRIEALVRQLEEKGERLIAMEDEIDKLEKTIGPDQLEHEEEEHEATGIVNNEAVPSFGVPSSQRLERMESVDDNPLPCMSSQPLSLAMARLERRVSFQTGNA